MADQFVHINGAIRPMGEAAVSVFDRGLLYGDGLYETIRVRNRWCIRFDLHMTRLANGLAALDIRIPEIDFQTAIFDLLTANSLSDARVRLTITRGESPDAGNPTTVITAVPLSPHGLDPTKAIIISHRRDETSPLTGVKTINCLASVMSVIEARNKGADDAVLLNTSGNAAEATTANLFAVSGRRLLTPSLDQGCLPGTVRAAVLDLAPGLGLDAVEACIHPNDLGAADELFLTSAIRLARPIVELDGNTIGDGTYDICARIRESLLRDEQPEDG
jgi:branched-subunit amino acid aminotransferase/4-amino-4-deoxychorismate lyase